ncbi:MAG: twin-arginine translocase subunit TatC [Alphaproteobacteria bacterium]|nr:MAG: twin-arginine translocase subunit TatC [Alphaproteobacteria bacterium]
MSQDDIEATQAPLLDHLIELRQRLIYSFVAILIAFLICFYFAEDIFNILLVPYQEAVAALTPEGAKPSLSLIYTAPHEFFFTQIKLALFGALFIAFPVIAAQIWMFVAPGLYTNERQAFLPFLAATPVLFLSGAALVYFLVMPMGMQFFLGFEQVGGEGKASIQLVAKVSEYLSLIMTLIFAFGLCFQLPVLLTLLGRVGLVSSAGLRRNRKYAIVITFAVAAILTPPDPISQIGLGLPTLLLYELSIWAVQVVERRRAEGEEAERPQTPGKSTS